MTLIEVLLVMAILALLVAVVVGGLNPIALIGKANDSRRKSDLNKIRTAFEEYFNDKGDYPTSEQLRSWNIKDNCNKPIDEIKKYLRSWPCDPHGQTYLMIVDNDKDWFKVVTNLENKQDKDIPDGWYGDDTYVRYTALFDRQIVNYGVSSSNVLWYEGEGLASVCGNLSICLGGRTPGECNDRVGVGCSSPDICYQGTCSLEICRTSSCN